MMKGNIYTCQGQPTGEQAFPESALREAILPRGVRNSNSIRRICMVSLHSLESHVFIWFPNTQLHFLPVIISKWPSPNSGCGLGFSSRLPFYNLHQWMLLFWQGNLKFSTQRYGTQRGRVSVLQSALLSLVINNYSRNNQDKRMEVITSKSDIRLSQDFRKRSSPGRTVTGNVGNDCCLPTSFLFIFWVS